MPLIILEAGYAKSYDDLVDDATLLLEGAEGEINMVIIVKMEPLVEGETSFKSGFTEIWKFDEEDMKAKIYGPRLVSPHSSPSYKTRENLPEVRRFDN